MRKIIIAYLVLTHCVAVFPQAGSRNESSDPDYYRGLNEKETRLAEYRDNDEALRLKLIQLEVINSSRKKFRAPPVKLDILASRVANKMCREAAVNSYISHWNLAGEKPYHRYAFAGGYDHVSENAFGQWTSGEYDMSATLILKMMDEGHAGFMNERAPYDGHKKNITDKNHNFVGIGYYINAGQFRYYEEFLNRFLEFRNIPSELRVNEPSSITIDTKEQGYLSFMTVYRESLPKPMKVSQLSKTGSYEDYTDELYMKMPAWDLAAFRKGSVYIVPLIFSKEGLYYIQLFTDKKENTGNSAVSTKGKPPVSGIVIIVKK